MTEITQNLSLFIYVFIYLFHLAYALTFHPLSLQMVYLDALPQVYF